MQYLSAVETLADSSHTQDWFRSHRTTYLPVDNLQGRLQAALRETSGTTATARLLENYVVRQVEVVVCRYHPAQSGRRLSRDVFMMRTKAALSFLDVIFPLIHSTA